jgi:DNA modification methylase
VTVELHLGNCLSVMEGMADGLADSLVTDPPAGIAFMGKEWDKDCGGRDRWVEMLAARLAEARRVCKPGAYGLVWALPRTSHWTALALEEAGWVIRDRVSHLFGQGFPKSKSCLKPACEDWWLAWSPVKRVPPLPGLDACRIGVLDGEYASNCSGDRGHADNRNRESGFKMGCGRAASGRWPANVTHDGSPEVMEGFTDAARYFYCAKASRADRNEGLDGMPERFTATMGNGIGKREHDPTLPRAYTANHHPTVKPTELMRWLCRLITPPGGTVLDPFTGSGSTGKAAAMESLSFIGIEQNAEYLEIARRRIDAALAETPLFAGVEK